MGIKVNVSPDIATFKEKIFWNMSLRQLISIGIAFLLTLFLNSVFDLPSFIRRVLIVALVTPVLLIGFKTYQGLYFEKYLYFMFLKLWNPQIRLFKHEINVSKDIKDTKLNKGGASDEHDDRKENTGYSKKNKKRKASKG